MGTFILIVIGIIVLLGLLKISKSLDNISAMLAKKIYDDANEKKQQRQADRDKAFFASEMRRKDTK